MIIKASRWTKQEILETNAALYGAIFVLWDYNKRKKPVKFEDLLWVIAQANKAMFEKYTLDYMNVEIFNLFDFDKDIVPKNFAPKPIPKKGWAYYLSEAQIEELIRAFIKWKWYGKWCIRLNKLLKGQK